MGIFGTRPKRKPTSQVPVYSAPIPPPPYQPFVQSPYAQAPAQWAQSSTGFRLTHQPVQFVEPIQYAQPNLNDIIGDQFSDLIAWIDEETYQGLDEELTIVISSPPPSNPYHGPNKSKRSIVQHGQTQQAGRLLQTQTRTINILSKVSFYSNSRLPPNLPTLRVYIPTYPLLCLAAQYSADAYRSPQSAREREYFVSADAQLGTKAMVMKSVPCDDKKTLVFAIRGTSVLSPRDWNVNLSTAPVSPEGFLDDAGNLCHAGFLKVAKAMIKPIAGRLRTLLEENPSRASCSLLITGHSAGGAVASLLYAHMLSTGVQSELNILTGCFKRVHCVTFGAPPVSLLPLSKPTDSENRLRRSIFFSLINEGDPVVRAEKAYIKSLVDLLATPLSVSSPRNNKTSKPLGIISASISRLDLSVPAIEACKMKQTQIQPPSRIWRVPTATLSNAGRLVLLRVPPHPIANGKRNQKSAMQREIENVNMCTAHTISDDQLRGVVFGDPSMHAMAVYARRVEALALKAVTGRA